MTRTRISKHEFERRSKVASAQIIMTDAMSKADEETGGLYCSEWLRVLNTMQTRLISDMLQEDWKQDEQEEIK
jgi:hypothetical protein